MGLGSLALTGVYGHTGAADADRLIRSALDAGVTLLDTAGFYAGGQVESLIGRAVAGREEVVVTTRGGVRRHGPRGRRSSTGGPARWTGTATPHSVACAPAASTCSISTARTSAWPSSRAWRACRSWWRQGRSATWG
ncbi:hypothetical protein GCM10020219_036650 [Nonomuraea dietziae]